jgi:CPA1 family monovalent cation:H+ antiporter
MDPGTTTPITSAPVPLLEIASSFLVATALLAYVNQRFFKLPMAIGVMISALGLSLALAGLDAVGVLEGVHDHVETLLHSLDFSALVVQGMLSLLLFAGALHVDLSALREYRWQVGLLAVAGTLGTMFVVGFALWLVAPLVGIELSLLACLLFGALISPTDPIAVMGILKSAGAPKNVELVLTGESLFNDGIAVVAFAMVLGMLGGDAPPTLPEMALKLAREAGGGLLFGLVIGWIVIRLLASIDQNQIEVLITLAAVMGGYALATRLHVSGPLAMVVAGLVIGNHGRDLAMSDRSRQYVDMFWDLLDEILNAVLFALIVMEFIIIEFQPGLVVATFAAIGVTLLARALTVGLPIALAARAFKLPDGAWKVLTWGALRGGISVALALSLPSGPVRETLLGLTYGVVVFSILVQGLTIGRVVRHARADPGNER